MVSLAYVKHIVHDICLPHPDPHTSGILDQFSLPELQLPKIPGSWDSPHLRNRQNEGEHLMNCHDQGWFPPERVKDYPGAKLKIRVDRKNRQEDFPHDTVVQNPLASEEDTSSIPALGKFHLPQDNQAQGWALEPVSHNYWSLLAQNLCPERHKVIAMRSLHTATKE